MAAVRGETTGTGDGTGRHSGRQCGLERAGCFPTAATWGELLGPWSLGSPALEEQHEEQMN